MPLDSRANENIEAKEDFIRSSFSFKECTKFVPDKTGEDSSRCGCGELEHNHYHYNGSLISSNEWSRDVIRTIGSTNAFGVVKFFSGAHNLHKSAEFVRLSDDDNPLDVIELMNKHWGLLGNNSPLLCISVIGGMGTFCLEGKKKDIFCEGLIRAVFATNAWILTHGLNFGAVNVVSDAISSADSYHLRSEKMSKKIRCIGVAPWGFVQNRDKLIRLSYTRPQYLKYCIDCETPQNEAASLNKNHTHYIFVDDGFRNSFRCSEVSQFRKELECLIATPRKDGGCGVPVVRIIVGGDFDILENAVQSMQVGIPIVICAGTGKAADILSRALYCWRINKNEVGHRNPEWTVDQGIHLLETMMEYENFVSCFDLDEESVEAGFDRAILYALIKCSTTNPADQLMVALKFGRIDVVKEKIFPDGVGRLRSSIKKYHLNRLMTAALLENRSEFAEYLIEQELVEMSTYLDVSTLTRLYNELEDPSVMRRCLERLKVEVKHTQPSLTRAALLATTANILVSETETSDTANKMLEMLIRRDKEKPKDWINLPTVEGLLNKLLGSFNHPLYVEVTELFIWAVLNDRNELALIFWRNADDAVALGLIGCNLYGKMLQTLPLYNTEGRLAFANQKAYLEQAVKMMIELLYSKSRWRALYLLVRPLKTWGHHRCMPLAMQANCLEFISSIACQHAIQFEWRAGVHANIFSLVLAYICPPLIFTRLVGFSSNSKLVNNATEKNIIQRLKGKIKHANIEADPNESSVSVATKLRMFYCAPRTKFCIHTVFYVIFLAFFSYTLLFGMKPNSVTILEAILMTYLGAFCIETIRSCIKTANGRGSVYFLLGSWLSNDKWHAYDLALMVASAITICLRFGWDRSYIVAKSFYSVIFVFYFLRLFQFYSVNRKLGPNSVMIFQMLVELSIFLFILLIFLLPYGVSTQALLFPYMTEFKPEILKNVFYYPYYRIYGELFLEQSEASILFKLLKYPNGFIELLAISTNKRVILCSTIYVHFFPAKMEQCDPAKADGITCPMYNFLAPLFLAVYMLIVAVLLINLLIAIFSGFLPANRMIGKMIWLANNSVILLSLRGEVTKCLPASHFSNVFTAIETQSTQFWKSTMYYLLVEYEAKPVVPPPFSLLQALLEGVAYLLNASIRLCRRFTFREGKHKANKGNEYALEGAGDTPAYVEREGEGDNEAAEEVRDEETENFENSITQMERWTIRQILKQEASEDTNQISKIYRMVKEVRNSLASENQPDEPAPQSASAPRGTPSHKVSFVWQRSLHKRILAMESKVENSLKHQESMLQQLLGQVETKK
ncbi:Transient receptor potential cation channel subfamily M member [Echinococcus granulosus]|uniref:Transient receptor potential cation channel subfamily M member n=1 Tax=Echinococcus granulosus TaxID=6210 RepID=W6UB86_ECHGR|nr:Transient receptor potential cation channel subfamily M member [Echinococcus granulosus]EUB57796.1 Transient receptor potential cation channel subfamily M member [Echinococcus granulosus]